jgi:serine/threonine protein kinase
MPRSVGTKLGPYEILAPIGAGGIGEVYRAKDTELKREVALKVLPDSFASDGVEEVGTLVRASGTFLCHVRALAANARIVLDLAGQVLVGQQELP